MLAEIHRRLARQLGPQGPFRLLDPASQLAMAKVGGKTHSEISRSAFETLAQRYGCWEAVRNAPVAAIRAAIGTVSYPERKAPLIKNARLQQAPSRHTKKRLSRLRLSR